VSKAAALEDRARAMAGWWRSRGMVVQDGALAAVLTAAAFVPQFQGKGVAMGQLSLRDADALADVLTAAQSLPLALRHRQPAVCLAVIGGAFAAYQSLGYPSTLASVGLLVALYSAGAHARRFRAQLGTAASAVYVALAIVLHDLHAPQTLVDYVTFYVVLLACWGTGAWVRARRFTQTERQSRATQEAMAEERARIARELHDVVTHHVTAMVVQADAAQFLVGGPDRADAPEPAAAAPVQNADPVAESLSAISGTGRRALAELRQLLGVLDAPGGAADGGSAGPEQTLGRLRHLVGQTQRAGQPVELIEDGERGPLAASLELAAYRVVQEALTNAVKHAHGRRTVVRVCYGDELSIDVSTDGPVIPAGAFTPGRGLTGLRERVSTCGGELTAGGLPGGGFSVRARMPSKARA
jgi:signal transduction histidine kinase